MIQKGNILHCIVHKNLDIVSKPKFNLGESRSMLLVMEVKSDGSLIVESIPDCDVIYKAFTKIQLNPVHDSIYVNRFGNQNYYYNVVCSGEVGLKTILFNSSDVKMDSPPSLLPDPEKCNLYINMDNWSEDCSSELGWRIKNSNGVKLWFIKTPLDWTPLVNRIVLDAELDWNTRNFKNTPSMYGIWYYQVNKGSPEKIIPSRIFPNTCVLIWKGESNFKLIE